MTARVADVIERFLAVNRPQLSHETMRNYDWYGQAFAEHSGFVLAAELKPHHVTSFLAEKTDWGPTTQYNARRSLFVHLAGQHKHLHAAVERVARGAGTPAASADALQPSRQRG